MLNRPSRNSSRVAELLLTAVASFTLACGEPTPPVDASIPADGTPAAGDTISITPVPRTLDYSVVQVDAVSSIIGTTPANFHVHAAVRDTANVALLAEYGGCPVDADLYRTPDRGGTPVWRSALRNHGCPAVLVNDLVLPHDSLVLTLDVPVSEVAGDSLAAGRYYVTAIVHLEGSPASGVPARPALTQSVAAGEIDLPRE